MYRSLGGNMALVTTANGIEVINSLVPGSCGRWLFGRNWLKTFPTGFKKQTNMNIHLFPNYGIEVVEQVIVSLWKRKIGINNIHTQYSDCWWPSDTRSQGISSHGTDIVIPDKSSFSTRSAKFSYFHVHTVSDSLKCADSQSYYILGTKQVKTA